MDKVKTANNLFMILERSATNLELQKDGGDYILEGIAAVFGEENNNSRVYEEKEYLPHLEYLNKKITKKSLMGELDHPEKFDVSLKNASHIIESLNYDPTNRQLRIRVKLLDTPSGRIAKNLVDNDVPVSISSRAAGLVEHDKTVRIKRIFTYDLVADPGFENAQLSRVNESLGFGDVENIDIIDISKDKDLYENFVKSLEREGVSIEENTPSKNMNQFVKVDELHNYSMIIKKELTSIKETINKLSSNPSVNEDKKAQNDRVVKLENYVNYIAENLDKNIQYSEYLANHVDKNIEYSKYIAENLDRTISYSEYLAETVDKNISYSNYLAESVDRNISYSEYLAEKVDQNIGYSEHLGENLNKGINYAEYIGEKLDKNIGYAEYIAENLDSNISQFNKLNEASSEKNEKNEKNEKEDEYIESDEEKVEETISKKYEKISSKVDNLIESVKKQKIDELITESNHTFFRVLSDEKRKLFLSLEETEKTKVTEALEKAAYTTEEDIIKLWDVALTETSSELPKFISDMPEHVKPIWESMNERQQEAIVAQSAGYNLQTPYQIGHFWDTRNLKDIPVLEKLNEEKSASSPEEAIKVGLRGYNSDYVNSIMEGLDKYKPRN